MPSGIDIIVTGPDATDVRLVAETKIRLQDTEAVESQLKKAMLRVSAPVGLLITPKTLRVYIDSYSSRSPESVQFKGEFDISHLLVFIDGVDLGDTDRLFEDAVQHWLQDLPRTATPNKIKDPRFWEILSTYVLPAVESGEVRAAGPRYL